MLCKHPQPKLKALNPSSDKLWINYDRWEPACSHTCTLPSLHCQLSRASLSKPRMVCQDFNLGSPMAKCKNHNDSVSEGCLWGSSEQKQRFGVCASLRNKQGVKHRNPFTRSTTAKVTNTAFQEDGLHLPWEPLLPKLAWILHSLSDVEVSNTMLFYFTVSWGVECTNHTPCVHPAASPVLASGL